MLGGNSDQAGLLRPKPRSVERNPGLPADVGQGGLTTPILTVEQKFPAIDENPQQILKPFANTGG